MRRARIEFGGAESVREECRQARGLQWFDDIRCDLHYAARMFRHNPGFAAIAVLSLGLGIGANTAIFTLVDTVLLKFLPVRQPERLVFIDSTGGRSEGSDAPPYPCFERFRNESKYFAGVAAFESSQEKAMVNGSQEKVAAQYVSGNYFDLLGVPAVLGRTLAARDDSVVGQGGRDGAVGVISYGFWKRRFAGDPAVLVKVIQLGSHPVTIVGVTPPEFFGLRTGTSPDVTVPMMLHGDSLHETASWWFSAVARLRDDAAAEQARAQLDAIFQSYMDGLVKDTSLPLETRRILVQMRKTEFDRIALIPASKGLGELRRQFSKPLLTIMVIVGLVLLIGCANVANLLLARASARQSEMSIRLAVGASRGRLMRQMFTEGLLLVVLGAGLGLLWARWGVTFLIHFFSARGRDPIVLQPHFDAGVLGFTLAVAVITGLFFSLAPALDATRRDPVEIAESSRTTFTRSSSRAGRALVMLQVMLSLVLLCGAALFTRTLYNLRNLDAGFSRQGVLSMQVEAVLPSFSSDPAALRKVFGAQTAKTARMWRGLLERLKVLPGVQSASAGTLSPFGGKDRGVLIGIAGKPPLSEPDSSIELNQVSPEYFDTLGVRLLAGRLFTLQDQPNSIKVAILNEAAARFYFGTENPIGRKISFPGQMVSSEYDVVGVSRDVRYRNLRDRAERLVYLPLTQPLDRITTILLAVRTRSGIAKTLMQPVRKAVREQIPGGFVTNIATIDQQVSDSLVQERLVSLLASFFSALALLLACIGIYGILSFAVLRRMREFGIRFALGARRAAVIWLILRETVLLVGGGMALGIPVVLVTGRYIQSQLFGVKPIDATALAAAVLILAAVAGLAAFFPARRASQLDPNVALRYE
jgi:predicted permease